jgi:hypothetical protein
MHNGLGLQVVFIRVGRLESDFCLCISEQVCKFLYQRTIKVESDTILALRVRHDTCCILLFLKYFVSKVM